MHNAHVHPVILVIQMWNVNHRLLVVVPVIHAVIMPVVEMLPEALNVAVLQDVLEIQDEDAYAVENNLIFVLINHVV